MAITAKEAAERAASYLKDFIPTASRFLVEEVQRVATKEVWLITLSYSPAFEGGVWLANGSDRAFKVFEIDMDSGEVISMKIRQMS